MYLCLLKCVNPTVTAFAQAAGLIGCFRFLEGFYLLLVTQRRYQGTVCGENALQAVFLQVLSKQGVQQNGDIAGQKVYGIDKTLLVPLVQPSVDIVQGQVSGNAVVHPPLLSQVLPPCRSDRQSFCILMCTICCVREGKRLLRSATASCSCQALSSTKTSTSATPTTLQEPCKQT